MASSDLCRVRFEVDFMIAHPKAGAKVKKAYADDHRYPDAIGHALQPWPHPESRSILRVCETLADAGLPVLCKYPVHPAPDDPMAEPVDAGSIFEPMPLSKFRVWNDHLRVNSGSVTGRDEFELNYWYVQRAANIDHIEGDGHLTAPKCYNWYAITVSSPVLADLRNPVQPDVHRLNSVVEVVCATLRDNLKIWLNSKCGTRICIAPATLQLFFEPTKKLAALVLIVEKGLLLKMCHPERPKTTTNAKPKVEAVTTESKIAKDVWKDTTRVTASTELYMNKIRDRRDDGAPRSKDVDKNFLKLWQVISRSSLPNLSNGLRSYRKGFYSRIFDPCAFAIRAETWIDFTYLEGSLDPRFITLWVDIIRSLERISQFPFEEYCTKLCDLYDLATGKPEADWTKFLEAIFLEHHTGFCKYQIREYGKSLKHQDKRGIVSATYNA